MNKKIIAILLSLCLAALMGGCGGTGESGTTGSGAGESTAPAETSESTAPAKEVMDGFDKETNQTVTVGNVKFSVPEYYEEDEDKADDGKHFYYAETGKSSVMLYLNGSELDGKSGSFGKEAQETLMNSFLNGVDGSTLKSQELELEIASLPAGMFTFTGEVSDIPYSAKTYMFYNEEMNSVCLVTLMQTDNSEYDYFPDFDKIVRSAKAEKKPKVSKDFKKTMDDYEKFFDKYVEFMKNYQESDDVMGMLSDYTEIMSQYTEMMSGLESIDADSLSPADYAYYMEVYGRIMQKLSEVTGR